MLIITSLIFNIMKTMPGMNSKSKNPIGVCTIVPRWSTKGTVKATAPIVSFSLTSFGSASSLASPLVIELHVFFE
jgi:hypothetical protein